MEENWPPGFRFHPTDEELILYYLKRKICHRKLKLDIIAEIDVYKQEPEELPGLSLLKNGDRLWFFFTPKNRKYPNGHRSNRSTKHGYWKATGKDRTITCNSRNVGVKKTLVFYRGRAPSGERTDWVMHEYILHDDELKRCQKAQDYYVIYKLFQKSGPGPKNGEQYGAPFREEDWVDDDERPENPSSSDQANHAHEVNNVLATNSCGNERAHVLLDDIDEVMNRIIPEPAPLPEDLDEFERALSQFVGEEEPQRTVIHASIGEAEANYPESCSTYPLGRVQNGLGGSLNVSPTTSGMQLWDLPEVASTSNRIALSPYVADDDYFEVEDLLAPDTIQGYPSQVAPPHLSGNNLFENSQLTQDDGLSEFDLFYDPGFSVQDHLHSNQAMPSVSYPESQEGELVGQVITSETQLYANYVNCYGNEMWSFDSSSYMPTTAEPNQQPIPLPTTGVVYGGSYAVQKPNQNQNQNPSQNQNQNPAWFSSTLWSLVESIPAAPASAAESDLVNKAFQRMSSFSRIRMINAKSINASANGASVFARNGVGSIRIKSLSIFSFLMALFAFVCVSIGSTVCVFGKVNRHMNL